jgi:hypothetical protein
MIKSATAATRGRNECEDAKDPSLHFWKFPSAPTAPCNEKGRNLFSFTFGLALFVMGSS